MAAAAALIYWVIVLVWLVVLSTMAILYARNPRMFGTTRLLLAVLLIDTLRNIVENSYFGLYFGSSYGLFPAALSGFVTQHRTVTPRRRTLMLMKGITK